MQKPDISRDNKINVKENIEIAAADYSYRKKIIQILVRKLSMI